MTYTESVNDIGVIDAMEAGIKPHVRYGDENLDMYLMTEIPIPKMKPHLINHVSDAIDLTELRERGVTERREEIYDNAS